MRILSNLACPNEKGHEVLCFSGTFQDNGYYGNQKPCFFPEILEKIPAGWEPDIVLFKSPLYFAVPYGIEDSPFPTVLLLDDWFGGVDYLQDTFAKFDYVFTDKTSVALMRSLGFENVDYWPLFPYPPSLFHLIADEKRIYDVTFTGNFNVNVQGKRLPWLSRLAALDRKYSVRLFHHAWHDEYTKILNQSRIVFNHSIKSEMNQRAFEAPACGALLFMEEKNLEVRDFFTPGKECILYNDKNFEELLDYYLTNEKERADIAQRGWVRAQEFSAPKVFDLLVDKIHGLGLTAGKGRNNPAKYTSLPLHRDFVQASLSKFGRGESTLKNITQLVSDPGANSLLLNDCGVILMSYADDSKSTLGLAGHLSLSTNALALLTHAASGASGFLTPDFNRAQILLAVGRVPEAAEIYKRLYASAVPDSNESCKGIVYPVHYGNPLRYSWNMALAETLPDTRAMAKKRHDIIRFFSAVNLALVAEADGNLAGGDTVSWYEKANSINSVDPQVTLALARLYIKNNHPAARGMASAALSANPFYVDFWKEWAEYLIDVGSRDEAKKFIESCLLCLCRLQSATPEMIADFETLAKTLDERKG